MPSLQFPAWLATHGVAALAVFIGTALALFATMGSSNAQVRDSERNKVAVGASHACAIDLNEKALCWGASDAGQTSPPENKRASYRRVDAGADWTCLSDGSHWTCFGSRSGESQIYWQDYVWSTISGSNHTCPRSQSRDSERYIVECEGYNTYGQAAWGDAAWGEVDDGLNDWRVGADHNCLLDDSGRCPVGGAITWARLMYRMPVSAGSVQARIITVV